MNKSRYSQFVLWISTLLLLAGPLSAGAVRTGAKTLLMSIAGILFFTWLYTCTHDEAKRFKRTPLDLLILLLLAVALISCAFSIYAYASIQAFCMLCVYAGVYYVVTGSFDATMRTQALLFLAFASAAISLYGLAQFFDIFPHPWWKPQGLLAATYVNHNHFAGYLELVFIPAAALFLTHRTFSKGRLFLLYTALVAMGAAFLFSQSRAGWVSSIFALCLLLGACAAQHLLLKKRCIVFLLTVVMVCACGFFVYPQISRRMRSLTVKGVEEASLRDRLKIWQGAVTMIQDRPLSGWGLGTFEYSFMRHKPEGLLTRPRFAHNDYLQFAAEGGIVYAVIMVVIGSIVFRKAFSPRQPASAEAIGCAAALAAFSLHNLVDFNFHIPANMLIASVWVAFIMNGGQRKTGK